MSLEISREERQGIEILRLQGQLASGHEEREFRSEFDRLVDGENVLVVFDLTGLSKVGSAVLAMIVFARQRLNAAGGNLAVFNTNSSNMEPSTEAQLKMTLPVFETKEDALESLSPDPAIKHYDVLELVQSFKLQKEEA